MAVDLDWEHPAAGAERNALFPAMLTRIKQEFGDSRRVYATVAPSVIVSNTIFEGPHAIDGVSLMTYDLGWWSNDPSNANTGQHSLQADVETAVRAWTDAPGSTNQRPWVFGSWGNDVPTDKLGIGLPMYGRGFNGSSAGLAVTYRDLIAGGTTSNGSNYQYQGSDVWIPSPEMVRQRVDFAVAQDLQNIIIWELAQDLPPDHQNSMLCAAQRPDGDFNGDGAWDSSDIDALSAAIATAGNDASFDMNGDGVITLADITSDQVGWLAIGGARNPQATGGNPFLSGDANLDGSVDVSDFNLWNNNKFTSAGSWSRGDFNADGVVDVSDFNVWNTTKFNRSQSAAAAVPEPAACWQLFVMGMAALLLARALELPRKSQSLPGPESSFSFWAARPRRQVLGLRRQKHSFRLAASQRKSLSQRICGKNGDRDFRRRAAGDANPTGRRTPPQIAVEIPRQSAFNRAICSGSRLNEKQHFPPGQRSSGNVTTAVDGPDRARSLTR